MNSKTNKAPGIFFTYKHVVILRDYSDSLINPSSTQACFKGYKESKTFSYPYKEEASNTSKYF